MIGVFYMSNVLLAIVFDNYKKRVVKMSESKIQKRMTFIKMYYEQFDPDDLGYLTYKQARNFFQQVLEMNFKRKAHRQRFVQVIKIVDPEHYKIVTKERILEFFEISGFKIIAQLDAEQKRLQRAMLAEKEAQDKV